jgi:hypothetical protein
MAREIALSPACYGKPMDRKQGEAILHEATGGKLSYEEFELISKSSGP